MTGVDFSEDYNTNMKLVNNNIDNNKNNINDNIDVMNDMHFT